MKLDSEKVKEAIRYWLSETDQLPDDCDAAIDFATHPGYEDFDYAEITIVSKQEIANTMPERIIS